MMRAMTVTLLGVVLVGCGPTTPSEDAPTLGPPGTQVGVTRWSPGPRSYADYTGFDEPAALTINTQEAFAEAWSRILNGSTHGPEEMPEPNFTDSTIVLVAMGMRNTGGFSVVVDSAVVGADGSLRVYSTQSALGAGCVSTDAPTQPVDVAQIPRWMGSTDFISRSITVDCD